MCACNVSGQSASIRNVTDQNLAPNIIMLLNRLCSSANQFHLRRDDFQILRSLAGELMPYRQYGIQDSNKSFCRGCCDGLAPFPIAGGGLLPAFRIAAFSKSSGCSPIRPLCPSSPVPLSSLCPLSCFSL